MIDSITEDEEKLSDVEDVRSYNEEEDGTIGAMLELKSGEVGETLEPREFEV